MDENSINGPGSPIYYEIIDGIVFVRVSQVVDVGDLLSIRLSIIDDPEFKSGMPTLYDFRQGTLNVITKDHVKSIGQQTDSIIEKRGKHRTAFLAGDDLSYGLARMYEIIAEHPDVNRQVFHNEEEAINWLKEDND